IRKRGGDPVHHRRRGRGHPVAARGARRSSDGVPWRVVRGASSAVEPDLESSMATNTSAPRQSLDAGKMLSGFGRLLRGYSPLLSIEITRECPLRCPGCYAYGDDHLGGGVTLRGLRDFTGDALVNGVLEV